MPGARGSNQKLISLHVEEELYEAAEKSRGRVNRSQWIRDAIVEKLKREGIPLPEGIELAPDRAGKGGRPKKADNPAAVARAAEGDETLPNPRLVDEPGENQHVRKETSYKATKKKAKK
jgi:hypothetical protein